MSCSPASSGSGATPPLTLTGTDPTTIPLAVRSPNGQTADIFTVRSGDGSYAIEIAPSGNGVGAISIISGGTAAVLIDGAGGTTLDAGSQSASVQGAQLLFVGATAAPPDAIVATSSFALWLDTTPAATKLMVKAKDSNGTVKTASITLV